MRFVSLNCGSIKANEKFLPALVALCLDTLNGVFEYSGAGYQRTHGARDNFHIVETLDGVPYDLYLKRHRGFEPKELLKLLAAEEPFTTAGRREWENILALEHIGIPTMTPVAFGEKKFGCFEVASFVVTERIPAAEPLDDHLKNHFAGALDRGMLREKRALLWDLGGLVRKLHTAGLTHMDLYLNHIFVRKTASGERVLHLIDLQRVARRWLFRRRWIVKDLAALLYSAKGLSFKKTDYARIFTAYFDGRRLRPDKSLVRSALRRARRMAAKSPGCPVASPPLAPTS